MVNSFISSKLLVVTIVQRELFDTINKQKGVTWCYLWAQWFALWSNTNYLMLPLGLIGERFDPYLLEYPVQPPLISSSSCPRRCLLHNPLGWRNAFCILIFPPPPWKSMTSGCRYQANSWRCVSVCPWTLKGIP